MIYASTLLWLVTILFSLYIGNELFRFFVHKKRLAYLAQAPFPESYLEVLQNIDHYTALDDDEKAEMHFLIRRFIDEKAMVGLQGLTLTAEIKVVIAFYACLLLLHIQKHDLYGSLETIYIYPFEFTYKEVRDYDGIATKQRLILEGVSANDAMLISWHNAKKDAYHHFESNVMIHEFAHELDYLDGSVDGVPPMNNALYATWSHYLFGTFKRLNSKSLKGRFLGKYKLFGDYAASNEAEFFAVATERFFQTPLALKKKFPNVYAQLKKFYRLDTAKKFG